jgi:hypothetical protein
MLKLVFAEVGPGPTLELGPFPAVRIDGETMRAERGGAVLAQHKPTAWEVQGKPYFRVDCASLVRLQFENPDGECSELSTSFTHFSCADGIAYADGEIYGHIDLDSRRWFSHVDRRFWQTLIINSASAPAA